MPEAKTEVLYRHSKRPEWGLAVPAWETADNQAYKFEDGRTRVIKKSFNHLMKPAEIDEAVVDRLGSELRRAAGNRADLKSRRLKPAYPFSDQIKVFRELFPEGFRGERWTKQYREPVGSPLKRHRAPAIELAQNKLSLNDLDELIALGKTGEIVDRAIEVLRSTSLAVVADVEAISGLEQEHRESVGLALRELLYGDDGFGERFRQWLKALSEGLGKQPKWRTVTALPALVYPDEHPCVRQSVFRKQAAVFAPRRGYAREPGRVAYQNFSDIAELTRERLKKEGFEPRDLLDVHDFIWTTLRPAAAKQISDD